MSPVRTSPLEVGEQAPQFKLRSSLGGEEITLDDYLTDGPVVLA